MEKEDQDVQIMEQCGDSSDDENDERFPVLGEWREEGFGNPVVQDIRCPLWMLFAANAGVGGPQLFLLGGACHPSTGR